MRYPLKKSAAVVLVAVLLFTLSLGACIAAFVWSGRAYAEVALSQEYYFLVRACEDSTASAVVGDAYLSGGAGFLTPSGKEVVLACYYTESDASFVCETMRGKGVEASVLHLSAEKFSLGGRDAAERSRVEANAATADSCARILFDAANGLERAELSQEGARAAVRGVGKSLRGLADGNAGALYSLWNAELYRAERRARELAEGVIFPRDLRYLQVQLCFSILRSHEYFS